MMEVEVAIVVAVRLWGADENQWGELLCLGGLRAEMGSGTLRR